MFVVPRAPLPTERTSIWGEESPQHLWPAPLSKHPLDLCHAVAGLVSPCCPCLTSTFSTVTPTCTVHTLLHTHMHARTVPACSCVTIDRVSSISLTTLNDLSGAVKSCNWGQNLFYVTAQYASTVPVLTSEMKTVEFFLKKKVVSRSQHILVL